MIFRYNEFSVYERDIAGIEDWTTQRILETEIEARQYLGMDMQVNEDVLDSIRHAREVSYKCDKILKERKQRQMKEWERLFD